jgi:hypothetical protein
MNVDGFGPCTQEHTEGHHPAGSHVGQPGQGLVCLMDSLLNFFRGIVRSTRMPQSSMIPGFPASVVVSLVSVSFDPAPLCGLRFFLSTLQAKSPEKALHVPSSCVR